MSLKSRRGYYLKVLSPTYAPNLNIFSIQSELLSKNDLQERVRQERQCRSIPIIGCPKSIPEQFDIFHIDLDLFWYFIIYYYNIFHGF